MDQDFPTQAEKEIERDYSKFGRGPPPSHDLLPRKSKGAGHPPLETAMRSVYREARRFRTGINPDPSTELQQLDHCTFQPVVNRKRKQSLSPSRNGVFAGASKSMSTKDMQEYIELQECTFTPNLYKHLARQKRVEKLYEFASNDPQYRSERRGPNQMIREVELLPEKEGHAEGAQHVNGSRGRWYWQEHLRPNSAASQYSANALLGRGDLSPDKKANPASGMDLSVRGIRHDAHQTTALPRDWGRYIRASDLRFGTGPRPQKNEGVTTHDSTAGPGENSRAFAETFLALRASQGCMRPQTAPLKH